MNTNIIHNPGVYGAAVSITSGGVSWFASTLPLVQWFAAALGAVAAVVSIAWILKQWLFGKGR